MLCNETVSVVQAIDAMLTQRDPFLLVWCICFDNFSGCLVAVCDRTFCVGEDRGALVVQTVPLNHDCTAIFTDAGCLFAHSGRVAGGVVEAYISR